MTENEQRELAIQLDRMRLFSARLRLGEVVYEFESGWLGCAPGGLGLFWATPARAMSGGEVDEQLARWRAMGLKTVFVMVPPWGATAEVGEALKRAGAMRVPTVQYAGMRRAASADVAVPTTGFAVRLMSGEDVSLLLPGAAAWYPEEGVNAARAMVERGGAVMHGAFEGDRLAGFGVLRVDGGWGWFIAAGTSPTYQRRGVQSALIAARIAHSARLGARWCAAESVSTSPSSWRNVLRAGFEEAYQLGAVRVDLA